MKVKAKEIAEKIKSTASELGWKCYINEGILTIIKKFTPESNDEFIKADGEYHSILGLLPQSSSGSVWGTMGDAETNIYWQPWAVCVVYFNW